MSNETQQSSAEIRQNTISKVAELTKQLADIDNSEEAVKARDLLQLYSALHVDPSGNAVDEQGRTATEVYEEYEKVSKQVGEQKKPLEQQLADFQKGLGMVADYQTLRQAAKERAEASAKACQEPFKDLTSFGNPELDKIRSQLQTNPLPGGDKASIDDGSGGQKVTVTGDQAATQQ